MRILCIGSMYPPHHLGGYELLWQAAVDDLRARGHVVRVLASDHREAAAVGALEDGDVHRELRWYWRDHVFPRLGPRARLSLERANAATFDRHVDEFAPDVIAWWAMGGMSLSLFERARRLGIPGVGFVFDDWLIYGPLTDAWIRFATRPGVPADLLERITGLPTRFDPQASAHFVFASEETRRVSLERWPIEGTEIAHGGIDAAFLERQSPPTASGAGGCSTSAGSTPQGHRDRDQGARTAPVAGRAARSSAGGTRHTSRNSATSSMSLGLGRAGELRRTTPAGRAGGGLRGGRCRRLPSRVGRAVGSRPARGDGLPPAGRRDRDGWVVGVPARRGELPALQAGRRRRPGGADRAARERRGAS